MATIKFVRGEEREFLTVDQLADRYPHMRATMEQRPISELLGSTCFHHDGTVDEPQLFEVQFPPNHEVAAHAHQVDEIVYVVSGEIIFGKQVYGAGSSVYIPKMTLYSFRTGPEGLVFLNFRTSRVDEASIPKDVFLAERAEARAQGQA